MVARLLGFQVEIFRPLHPHDPADATSRQAPDRLLMAWTDAGGGYARYSSLSSRKLAWPPRPTMTWSCTAMPSGRAISIRDCVIWMSVRDGVGSPDGWLCTRMMAVAESSSARLTTSRG